MTISASASEEECVTVVRESKIVRNSESCNLQNEDEEHVEASPDKASASSSRIPQTEPKIKKWSGVKNQHKMKTFVNWLVQTFPQLNKVHRTASKDITRDGTLHTTVVVQEETPLEATPLVIDIAGGKGELAARLIMCQRLRVVMIDPRESDVPLCFEKTVLPKLPAVWRCRFQRRQQDDPQMLIQTFQERFQQYRMYFSDDTVVTHPELEALIQNATLLVGMHADGATEAIVDTALRYKKPFCVVPCCVFPKLFHTRTVTVMDEEGNKRQKPVRSYEQFCQYLMDKHPGFQQSILPFDGRNVAIWWDGKSY